MKMTNDEYKKYAQRHSPRSSSGRNFIKAFLSGGAICLLGQLMLDMYLSFGLETQDAFTAVSVSLIFIGAALTAAGVYDDIAFYSGAGSLVPITGFANSVAAPALEFKTEGFVLGTCVKMFTIAGPVLTWGISASVVYGLVLWLAEVMG